MIGGLPEGRGVLGGEVAKGKKNQDNWKSVINKKQCNKISIKNKLHSVFKKQKGNLPVISHNTHTHTHTTWKSRNTWVIVMATTY